MVDTCLLTIILCLKIRFIVNILQDYLTYDVVSKIKVIRQAKMLFPAVHICAQEGQGLHILQASFKEESIHVPSTFTHGFELGYNCFIFNDVKIFNFYQTDVGKFSALRVTLYLQKSGSNLLKLIVADKGIFPQYRDFKKLIIGPSEINDISLSKQVSKILPEPYNHCYNNLDTKDSFDSELYKLTFKNESGYIYRQVNCFDVCTFKNISLECNCIVDKPHANKDHAKDCLLSESLPLIECRKSIENRFDFLKHCTDACPQECTTSSYTINLHTLSYIPNENEIASLRNVYVSTGNLKANWSYDKLYADLLESGLRLNIYFDDLKYEEISETPETSGTDLISNIGGTMGKITS
jgi:hypothetical protein